MAVVCVVSNKPERFGSIDAVRGAAILFVFLSHFTAGYVWTPASQEIGDYLRTLSMIASPTFVIVSGMVAGFLASTNPDGFGDLRLKLFDRGVFLLVGGHLFLTMMQAPTAEHFGHSYRASFITDVIAIAIMVGPSMVVHLSAVQRIGVAAGVFVADWWMISQWHPLGAAVTAKLYLIGLTSTTGELSAYPVFPVLPWFAVYLAATVIGERVGKMYVRDERKASHYMLARLGAASFIVTAVAHGAERVAQSIDPAAAWDMTRLGNLSIYGKFPPGVVYLGFFGGAGLMMLAGIFELDRAGRLPRLFNQLRKLGRSSLFLFTVQYGLYRAILPRLGFSYTPFWPLIFFASVILLALLAAIWDGQSANRYLTVGITKAWKAVAERTSSAPTAPAVT
jgi:uncharacterized membrane protein